MVTFLSESSNYFFTWIRNVAELMNSGATTVSCHQLIIYLEYIWVYLQCKEVRNEEIPYCIALLIHTFYLG